MTSRFRTSFTQQAGAEAAYILQGRIVNINLVNWTVDVVAQFDRKRFFEIQVGSPYLHFNRGEGLSIFPEIGATCMVCIPSDSSPPYVQSFIMPHETMTDTATDDAPAGTRSHGSKAAFATDASFAGGRPKAKPGDIWLRGRDGNFLILHRGGVLQIGATELAQRIYIPLTNLVTDISENYAHHNSSGSIVWGLQDGPSQVNYPAQYMHTFRVFANDKYADVRLVVGKVYNPIPEPDGGSGLASGGVGQSEDSPIICELTVAPKGFNAETGDVADSGVSKKSVLKFVFDRTGNTFLRCEGNLTFVVKKKLTIHVSDEVNFSTDAHMGLTAKKGLDINGGDYSHIKGDLVRLGRGTTPVACVGDLVRTLVTAVPCTIVFASTPLGGAPSAGVLTLGLPGAPVPIVGSIASGNNKVLA
jgi:hypothetical protein